LKANAGITKRPITAKLKGAFANVGLIVGIENIIAAAESPP
jgi:hypothetical protein